MFSAGVGVVFKNCWSRSRVFKNAGVGVGFLKLLESESGVGILKNLQTPQPWTSGMHRRPFEGRHLVQFSSTLYN